MAKPPTGRHVLTLAQEVAELRATYRLLPGRLVAVHNFETSWDQFAQRLRPLIQAMDGEPWNPADPRIAGEIAAVDDLRLDLQTRQSTVLPTYHDPLNTILHTSLRMAGLALYEVFGPLESHGVVQQQVLELRRFDAQMADAKADIVRYRREIEDQTQHDGSRLHELQGALPTLVLITIRELLWKTWWRRLITSAAAAILAWATPPVRAAVGALWDWIRALLHV